MYKLAASFGLVVLVALTGCSAGTVSDGTKAAAGVAAQGVYGSVHGGQQPVSGSTIQLWAVGTGGYGSAATPLISGSALTTSGVALTNATGGFNIAGQYTCPSASTLVYITSTGGNPGLAGGTNNSALVLMATLGQCGSLSSSTFVSINEVTTVASVYALAQFINPSTGSVGAYSFANTGLTNAFGTVSNLVNTSAGTALATTPNGNGVVPQAEINALADILAPCVNSTGGGSTPCAALFGDLQSSSGTAPTTTLLAALSMALHPGYNVSTLFGTVGSTPPFPTALSSPPNDWTLALSFATGATPYALALDSLGNVWTANAGASSVGLVSPLGVPATNSPYSSGSTISTPEGIAIDGSNNAWVANYGNSTGEELHATVSGGNSTIGAVAGPYNGLGYEGGGVDRPTSLAVDGSNDVWFDNYGNPTVTELFRGGASSTNYNGVSHPNSIAFDANGNAWIANTGAGSVVEISGAGTLSGASTSSYTGGGLSSPSAVAVDSLGDAWVTDSSLSRVVELNSSGTPISGSSGFTGGGLTSSSGLAVDGSNNVWVADLTGNRISELGSTGAITSGTGYQGGSLASPNGLAIDAAGDIWVSNGSPATVNSQAQTLTEFIGLAAPAVMPLAAGVQNAQVGQKPGSLVIVSRGISSAEATVAYSYTFQAAGGSGSYTWSVTSGLSALNTAGFSFSTGGVLAGTPSAANSYPITVQVRDTVTGLTSSAPYTLVVGSYVPTVCSHNGSGNAVLNGTYAFELSGFDGSGHLVGEVGDFKADGAGNITNGNGDLNSSGFASAGEQAYTFSGTYSVGSTDNRGILTANNTNTGATGLPATATYCFAADAISGGVASGGHILEVDSSGFVLSGFFAMQNSSSFTNASLTGGYAYGDRGVAAALYNGSVVPVRAGSIGLINFSGAGGVSSGQYDYTSYNPTAGSASYSAANAVTPTGSSYSVAANGRAAVTLNEGGTPFTFVLYLIGNGSQAYILSSGNWIENSLLVGKAVQQTTTTYTTANVKATGVYGSDGPSNPASGVSDQVRDGQFSFDGAGNLAYVQDQNTGGAITTPTSASSGTYTVVSPIGYVSLSIGPNFYLYAPGAGFGLGTGSGIAAYTMLPQTVPSGGFTTANLSTYLSGNYANGEVYPAVYSLAYTLPGLSGGNITLSSGSGSAVQDFTGEPAPNIAAAIPYTFTYALDPTVGANSGRFTVSSGGNTVFAGYIVSPTQFIMIGDQTNNDGLVNFADHW